MLAELEDTEVTYLYKKNNLTTMHKSANGHYMLSKYLSTVRSKSKCVVLFFSQKQKLLQISILYSGVYLIITHCAFIYFQEKFFPIRLFALYWSWTVQWQHCAFIDFGKISCPVRLFHTVHLLLTPE